MSYFAIFIVITQLYTASSQLKPENIGNERILFKQDTSPANGPYHPTPYNSSCTRKQPGLKTAFLKLLPHTPDLHLN